MTRQTIEIQCYGAFRRFGETLSIELETSTPTVSDIKQALIAFLGKAEENLVRDSALANDNAILSDRCVIAQGEGRLSILPPVCGG